MVHLVRRYRVEAWVVLHVARLDAVARAVQRTANLAVGVRSWQVIRLSSG